MRSFADIFGTSVKATVVIVDAIPQITFTDTTTGHDDWVIRASASELTFIREGTTQIWFDGNGDLYIRRAESGGGVFANITNTSSDAGSSARLRILVEDSATGASDPRIDFGEVTAGTYWALGYDKSASRKFGIGYGGLGGSYNVIESTVAGDVTIPLGDLSVSRATSGTPVISVVNSTSGVGNTKFLADSSAGTGDPYSVYKTNLASASLGLDKSADVFCINIDRDGVASDAAALRITPANNVTIPNGFLAVTNQADPGAVTGGVRLGSIDTASASIASLALRTEEPVVATGGTPANATATLTIVVNGASYNLMLEPR